METDVGIKERLSLQNLTSLSLNLTAVTDAGLKDLAQLKKLTDLSLFKSRVTDAGVAELGEFERRVSTSRIFLQSSESRVVR